MQVWVYCGVRVQVYAEVPPGLPATIPTSADARVSSLGTSEVVDAILRVDSAFPQDPL